MAKLLRRLKVTQNKRPVKDNEPGPACESLIVVDAVWKFKNNEHLFKLGIWNTTYKGGITDL